MRYGNPGNNGGRPRSIVREKAVKKTEPTIDWLAKVIDGSEQVDFITAYGLKIKMQAPMRDRLKAAELLHKLAGFDLEDESDGSARRTLTVRIVHE